MPKTIEVVLPREKECKGSVRFAVKDKALLDSLQVTNIYIGRTVNGQPDPDVAKAQLAKVTVQFA